MIIKEIKVLGHSYVKEYVLSLNPKSIQKTFKKSKRSTYVL